MVLQEDFLLAFYFETLKKARPLLAKLNVNFTVVTVFNFFKQALKVFLGQRLGTRFISDFRSLDDIGSLRGSSGI